jgi:predicted DNA-binding transcriptional regulator AlpA
MTQLLSKREVAEIIGFHPEHLMRLARAGAFPQPIKLGTATNCAVRFVAEEVASWVAARLAARVTKPMPAEPVPATKSGARPEAFLG